ncbi:MAG: hypothetical protein K9K37_02455 [Desulfocapsa sp.]|nr:hypothetical protein [Desulfocapsa sp.]
MKFTLLLSSLLMLTLVSSHGYASDPYKVVFETTDCSGKTGFATVGPDEIYKVADGDCSHPQHPGQKLKQLLVHDGSGSYKVYTLSQEEAKNVMLDVKEYMRSRKGVLDRSESVIISH